jgi:hypothetical protein
MLFCCLVTRERGGVRQGLVGARRSRAGLSAQQYAKVEHYSIIVLRNLASLHRPHEKRGRGRAPSKSFAVHKLAYGRGDKFPDNPQIRERAACQI